VMESIEKRFKRIVSDIFKVSPSELKNNTCFVKDLHAKSIDVIALIAATENEFGIKVTAEDAAKNTTIGETIKYLEKKLKEKNKTRKK